MLDFSSRSHALLALCMPSDLHVLRLLQSVRRHSSCLHRSSPQVVGSTAVAEWRPVEAFLKHDDLILPESHVSLSHGTSTAREQQGEEWKCIHVFRGEATERSSQFHVSGVYRTVRTRKVMGSMTL